MLSYLTRSKPSLTKAEVQSITTLVLDSYHAAISKVVTQLSALPDDVKSIEAIKQLSLDFELQKTDVNELLLFSDVAEKDKLKSINSKLSESILNFSQSLSALSPDEQNKCNAAVMPITLIWASVQSLDTIFDETHVQDAKEVATLISNAKTSLDEQYKLANEELLSFRKKIQDIESEHLTDKQGVGTNPYQIAEKARREFSDTQNYADDDLTLHRVKLINGLQKLKIANQRFFDLSKDLHDKSEELKVEYQKAQKQHTGLILTKLKSMSCISQFDEIESKDYVWSFAESKASLTETVEKIKAEMKSFENTQKTYEGQIAILADTAELADGIQEKPKGEHSADDYKREGELHRRDRLRRKAVAASVKTHLNSNPAEKKFTLGLSDNDFDEFNTSFIDLTVNKRLAQWSGNVRATSDEQQLKFVKLNEEKQPASEEYVDVNDIVEKSYQRTKKEFLFKQAIKAAEQKISVKAGIITALTAFRRELSQQLGSIPLGKMGTNEKYKFDNALPNTLATQLSFGEIFEISDAEEEKYKTNGTPYAKREAELTLKDLSNHYEFLLGVLERCEKLEKGWKKKYPKAYASAEKTLQSSSIDLGQLVQPVSLQEGEKVELHHKLRLTRQLKAIINQTFKNEAPNLEAASSKLAVLSITKIVNDPGTKKILTTHRGVADLEGTAFYLYLAASIATLGLAHAVCWASKFFYKPDSKDLQRFVVATPKSTSPAA